MCETSLLKKTRNLLLGGAVAALGSFGISSNVQAAANAYENFDYGPGANTNLGVPNNPSGWSTAWANTGPGGLTTSGSGKSLYFGQADNGLIVDGSTHIWSESSKGAERDLATPVNLGSETLYYTSLIRSYSGGADTIDFRVQLHDGFRCIW